MPFASVTPPMEVGRPSISMLLLFLFMGPAWIVVPAQSVPDVPHPASTSKTGLPLTFARHTGDLDDMVKRKTIRALVLYSRTGFFYVNGRPEGIYYEALNAFQQFVNQKPRAKRQHIDITFIPVRPDQVEAALNDGVGDVIAYGLVVTPARQQRVAFSIPIQTDVKQIVVTGKSFGPVTSLNDLAGKKIFVNPLTTYPQSLSNVNASLKKQGKPGIQIENADQSLMDEDLLEMVNAGLVPATITTTERADLWSQVLPNIKSYPNVVVGDEGQLAWAMRKSNPELKSLLDEFIKTRAVGSSFGNTLVRRYLEKDQFVKNATSEAELKKFDENVAYFKKYAGQKGSNEGLRALRVKLSIHKLILVALPGLEPGLFVLRGL